MKKNLASFLSKNKSEKIFSLIFLFLIILGTLFRARHFFAGRSLWLDEAMLALNILDLSFGELTQQPLPYEQGAPIGFLFFVKATTLLLGDSEYAFRLYSFIASLAALFLMAFLARKYLGKTGALFALALFASNIHLVYYSAETKQYMGDVAVALFLLFLLSRQLEREFSRREFALFSFLSVTLLWFSHPAVFLVAPVGIVLAFHYARLKNQEAFSFALFNLAISGTSWILLYFLHLRPLSANAFLRSFWQDAFIPFPPTLYWAKLYWNGILQHPLGLEAQPVIIFLIFLGGVLFFWQKHRLFASSLFLTFFLLFLAGVLQKYPPTERMLLFATPIFFLIFGAGLDALYSLLNSEKLGFFFRKILHKKSKTSLTSNESKKPLKKPSFFGSPVSSSLVFILAFFLLYTPFSISLDRFQTPLYREHIRPSLAYINEHLREDDLIYIYYYVEPAFLFYLPKYHLEEANYFIGGEHQENPESYLTEIDQLEKGRIWFLFTHVRENASINEEHFIVDHLDQIAEKKREYRAPGTSVSLYLYEFLVSSQ